MDLSPEWLSVSTLRGQFADNRDWAIDPSRAAIIIGTVDMIGSRLLFSGYRSSYKLRPLDAGLLGQDTLLVLDEAHLSAPFEKLIHALSAEGEFQNGQGLPMRIMCMSATTPAESSDRDTDEDAITSNGSARFTLKPSDLEGRPEDNPIIQRYEAKKWLTIHPPGDRKAIERDIINEAVRLAADNARVVVFVRRPEDAVAVAEGIRGGLKDSPDGIKVLTGTMRGLERDGLLAKAVLKRFLDGEEKPEERAGKGLAVLVSTSAGEVGFDLNADHMICDAAPLDSMIQRLGRVNRRGYRDARVHLFPEAEKSAGKGTSGRPKHSFKSAAREAVKCLEKLERNGPDGIYNASPKALCELRTRIEPAQLDRAYAPKPATRELTDVLLDAWSMTTIAKTMPGRPPVADWLRGIQAEGAETTIAWRAELDLDGFEQLDSDDIEEWFDAHRILPHETLSVPTKNAGRWILDRWDRLGGVAPERPYVIDRAGLWMFDLKELVNELKQELQQKRNGSVIDDAQIVLPASFGGIDDKGLLNPDAATQDPPTSPDVADARGRYRVLWTVDESGEHPQPLTGTVPGDRSGLARFALDLPSAGDSRRQLVSLVLKRQRPEFGTREQSLSEHVDLVAEYARKISGSLGLSVSDPAFKALELAAAWHDHGKDREIWQCAAGHKPGSPPLGKSGGKMRRIPGNYRHEFGSLREFIDAHEGKLSHELSQDVFDLAMHLIAVHHGRGRPQFPKGGFDPCARARSPQIAADCDPPVRAPPA